MCPNSFEDEQAARSIAANRIAVNPADSFNDGEGARCELCFRSLLHDGRQYAFPCDVRGRVDLNALSDRARNNYLYARALVGRDFSVPFVQRCARPRGP
jgi:hypothetical protein